MLGAWTEKTAVRRKKPRRTRSGLGTRVRSTGEKRRDGGGRRGTFGRSQLQSEGGVSADSEGELEPGREPVFIRRKDRMTVQELRLKH